MRVLHVLSAISIGGVEARHLQLVERLPSPEFEHLFIGTRRGSIADSIEATGTEVVTLGDVTSIFHPARYRRGIEVARAWQPDLVHGAVMEGNVLGVVVARRLGLPVIFEETSQPSNRAPMGHLLARVTARSATRCVAVSQPVGRYLVGRLRIPQAKVQVIVNGVARPKLPTDEDVDRLRASLGISPDDVVIGLVARLFNYYKRVTDLIAAFSLFAETTPHARLLIVGSGPDRAMMEDAAIRTGFGDRIHFVGRHTPADRFYGIMDIFSLPSGQEAFGLAAAEAMHVGLPVVASAVGGLNDVVDPGVTGFLVRPLAPDELASALATLVEDGELRRRMGEAGQKRAELLFSVERYVREVEALYRELTGPRCQ